MPCQVNLKTLLPGMKLLIGPNVHVKNGVMFLNARNTKVLGGEVLALLDQHHKFLTKERKILWNVKGFKGPKDGNAPPKFKPFLAEKANEIPFPKAAIGIQFDAIIKAQQEAAAAERLSAGAGMGECCALPRLSRLPRLLFLVCIMFIYHVCHVYHVYHVYQYQYQYQYHWQCRYTYQYHIALLPVFTARARGSARARGTTYHYS